MKRLSIVIVTYNDEKDIYDCIASIHKFADIPMSEVEVIVVDNSPADSAPMFEKLRNLYGNDIVLIRNDRNGGYGQGNNVGIRACTSPVVMVMNPDVRLYEPVFGKVLAAFDADAQLNLYGMKQMLDEHRPSKKTTDWTYMMNGWVRAFLSSFMSKSDWYFAKWMFISGACFFVRKSSFVEVGLFDEENFMYGEEDDIRLRLQHRYGVHTIYDRQLHYQHLIGERIISSKALVREAEACLLLYGKKGYKRQYILECFSQNLRAVLAYHKLLRLMGKSMPTIASEVDALAEIRAMMKLG